MKLLTKVPIGDLEFSNYAISKYTGSYLFSYYADLRWVLLNKVLYNESDQHFIMKLGALDGRIIGDP